jgi:hypothetical protein
MPQGQDQDKQQQDQEQRGQGQGGQERSQQQQDRQQDQQDRGQAKDSERSGYEMDDEDEDMGPQGQQRRQPARQAGQLNARRPGGTRASSWPAFSCDIRRERKTMKTNLMTVAALMALVAALPGCEKKTTIETPVAVPVPVPAPAPPAAVVPGTGSRSAGPPGAAGAPGMPGAPAPCDRGRFGARGSKARGATMAHGSIAGWRAGFRRPLRSGARRGRRAGSARTMNSMMTSAGASCRRTRRRRAASWQPGQAAPRARWRC